MPIKIFPSGRRPITLDGHLFLEDSTMESEGHAALQYWRIYLYRSSATESEGERYLVALHWSSDKRDENDYTHAEKFTSKDSLADYLENFDPLQHSLGFPRTEKFEYRQRKLEETLRAAWVRMLDRVLRKLFPAPDFN